MKIKTTYLLLIAFFLVLLSFSFTYAAENSKTVEQKPSKSKAEPNAKNNKTESDNEIDTFTPNIATSSSISSDKKSRKKKNTPPKTPEYAKIVAYNPPLQALTSMVTKDVFTVDVLFDSNATHLIETLTDSAKLKLTKAEYVVILDRVYNIDIVNYLKKYNPGVKLVVATDMKLINFLPIEQSFLNTKDPLLDYEKRHSVKKVKKKTKAELLAEAEALLDKNSASTYKLTKSYSSEPIAVENKTLTIPSMAIDKDLNFYLDTKKASLFIKYLQKYFIEQDKGNIDVYKANFRKYRRILKKVGSSTYSEIKSHSKNEVIFYSNNWQYFQKAYNIKQHPVILTESPDKRKFHKITPNEIDTLNTYVNKNKITCIFTEPQFDDLLLQKYIKEKQLRTASISYKGYNITTRSAISNYLYMLKYNSTIFSYCSN